MRQIGSQGISTLEAMSYHKSFIHHKRRMTQKFRKWQREMAIHHARQAALANRAAWDAKKAWRREVTA